MGIHHLMLLIGIGFLAASLQQSRKIVDLIPPVLRSRWRVMEGLIAFFLIGYVVEFLVRSRLHLGPAEYLISSVYMGGSVFVFLVMRLSRSSMRRLRNDEQKIIQMHGELWEAYESTIEGWGRALELRDRETEGHTRRVTTMTMALAARFPLSAKELRYIKFGALLHDIGKMAIPDAVLLNKGKLNEEEKAVMMRHPDYARQMLAGIEFLHPALDIPYCHHERWDGAGYPRGLKGEQIPLAARIFAVADVWDALAHERRYHKAWSTEEICGHLKAGAGTRFDPAVVDKFLELDLCLAAPQPLGHSVPEAETDPATNRQPGAGE